MLIEDSARNLKAARGLGLKTVLITRHGAQPAQRRLAGSFVGLRIHTLHALARVVATLTRGQLRRRGKLALPFPILQLELVWRRALD